MNAVLKTDLKNGSFTFDLTEEDKSTAEYHIAWFRCLVNRHAVRIGTEKLEIEDFMTFNELLIKLIDVVYFQTKIASWSIKAWIDFDVTEINYEITVSTHSRPFCLQERIKKLNNVKEK